MKEQKDFWGPKLWKLLHTVSYYSPEIMNDNQKKDYYYFYTFLVPRCIMCMKCQIHYRKMMEKNIFTGNTKNELIDYVIKIHNIVNRRLKKKRIIKNRC